MSQINPTDSGVKTVARESCGHHLIARHKPGRHPKTHLSRTGMTLILL